MRIIRQIKHWWWFKTLPPQFAGLRCLMDDMREILTPEAYKEFIENYNERLKTDEAME